MNKNSTGFILITVMLLLTILSLSAYVAIEQSQFSYKVNNARTSKVKARQVSEDVRLIALNKLITMLKNNELKLGSDSSNKTLSRYKKTGLELFLSLNRNYTDQAARAEVYVKKLPAQTIKQGVSLVQNMAYSGLGMGLGRYSSFAARYELRAKGVARNNERDVEFWTASDIRLMP